LLSLEINMNKTEVVKFWVNNQSYVKIILTKYWCMLVLLVI